MSRTSKDATKIAADLVSKGATLLSDPCPQCGGIQLRYRGKIFCVSHNDLSAVTSVAPVSNETVVAAMREVLLSRLSEAIAKLDAERDEEKQDQLVSLVTKYYDLLQKLPK